MKTKLLKTIIISAFIFTVGCAEKKVKPPAEKAFSDQYMVAVETIMRYQSLVDIKTISGITINNKKDICVIRQTDGIQVGIIRCKEFLDIFLSKVEMGR